MGRPKLLLSLGGRPLIAHTIDAWCRSRADWLFVVVRPGDTDLALAARYSAIEFHVPTSRPQIEIVFPDVPPPDMKASLQAALTHIEQHHQPTSDDAFLVAPADMPRLSPAIVNRLIDLHSTSNKKDILVPTISGQRGHPVLFPWPLAVQVFQLAGDQGLNAIVDREPTQMITCEDLTGSQQTPFADIDTPEQFRQMTNDQ
jgi:molybdenum cofactor cytidylyltransferase